MGGWRKRWFQAQSARFGKPDPNQALQKCGIVVNFLKKNKPKQNKNQTKKPPPKPKPQQTHSHFLFKPNSCQHREKNWWWHWILWKRLAYGANTSLLRETNLSSVFGGLTSFTLLAGFCQDFWELCLRHQYNAGDKLSQLIWTMRGNLLCWARHFLHVLCVFGHFWGFLLPYFSNLPLSSCRLWPSFDRAIQCSAVPQFLFSLILLMWFDVP